jgi:hypothetical protein
LILAGPLTRARHRTAIAWRLTCPVCGRDCTRERIPCDHAVSFVAEVAVEDVIAPALDLFAAERAP